MNILLIVDSYAKNSSGGRVSRYLVELLERLNYSVFILSPTKLDERNVFYFQSDYKLAQKKEYYQNILLDNKIDIIHFATYGNGKSTFYHNIARKINIKIVAQIWMHDFYCQKIYNFTQGHSCTKCIDNLNHSFYNRCLDLNINGLKKFVKKIIFKNNFLDCNKYISPSSQISGLLNKYGVNSTKIHNIPLLFDGKRFFAYNYTRSDDYYIFYGAIIVEKGIDFIIEFAKRYTDMKIKIVHSGEFDLKDIPNNLSICNNISWDNGLENLIKNAKAVLITSIWDSTTEYALLESLGLGVPAITFNVGVHKEIIVDNKNGFIVDIDNYKDFYNKLKLLDDENKRKSISINARRTFEKLTNEKQYLELLKKLYKELT
jgi:glycosyltransferase involved in cell wall biosynthesis